MLPNPVDVQVSEAHLTLAQATNIAQTKTMELHPEVMLLAWFHRQTGEYSPKIPC
jgi:hypothetical protein